MKTRVLVADDEESSRSGLVLLLTTLGYEVESAENGDEAIERARTFRPAVVIADLVMPGTDGLGVLKAVRAELPTPSPSCSPAMPASRPRWRPCARAPTTT